MVAIVVILLATYFFVNGHTMRNDSTCAHVVFKNTTDDVELDFLKHAEVFLEEHETIQTIASFLNEGRLFIAMRFFIELNVKSVHFQPDYLVLKVASKFDDKFVIPSLKSWDRKSFLQMLRVSFEKAYHKYNSDVKSDQQFDIMLLDETILKYLESFPKQTFILYMETTVTFSKVEIQLVEILYGIKNSCGFRDPSKRLDLSSTRNARSGSAAKEIGFIPSADNGNAEGGKQSNPDYNYE